MTKELLKVRNLSTSFFTYQGEIKAVRGISFRVGTKEALGIVGESGCGKSATALSIMRLLSTSGKIIDGEIILDNENLMNKTEKEMRNIRGRKIAMIFQDSAASLNPVLTIGNQMIEAILRFGGGISKKEAKLKASELLKYVKIPFPERIMSSYPHQLSGGMRQRAAIAMAISQEPLLLIADEPTSALDVTIQAQIIRLIKDIMNNKNMSALWISHDIGTVAEICDRIMVMYGGKIVESGLTADLINNPVHPYTMGLLGSIPSIDENYRSRRLDSIEGMPPDLLNPPAGCPFMPRCRYAMKICGNQLPDLYEVGEEHFSMCWLFHKDAPDLLRKKDRTEGTVCNGA